MTPIRRRIDRHDAGAQPEALSVLVETSAADGPIGSRREWTRFAVVAAVLAAALSAFVAVDAFRVAGRSVAATADEYAQFIASLAAGISCVLLAMRSTSRVRTAWALIGASTLVTSMVGAIVFVAFQVVQGRQAPFPSVADGFYLLAQVVLVGGVLSFPSSPAKTSSRSRLAIDALVIAVSLLYVSWAFGLGAMYRSAHVDLLKTSVGLAYPITDIVSITLMLLVIRRARRSKYPRLGILLSGLVVKLAADSAYAFMFATAGAEADSALPDIAWTAGYALIALACWIPAGKAMTALAETPVTLWRMVLPWTGLVAVMATVVVSQASNTPFDPLLVYPSVCLAALLLVSQLVSFRETLGFLAKSRRAEAALQARTQLLNQVIAHAPLGVARVSLKGRFLDANPRLGELLHASMKVLIGARITEFIQRGPDSDVVAKYEALERGEVDTVEEESPARRADGSSTWLHWSTTAVRNADGAIEYFLSMVEDMTARHEAEETAMANLAGLERLNKLKGEFVSMVSHEFRTALVGIQGFSELIRDDDLDPADIKGLANDINADAMRLNRMIGEMLDLDRMEAGKIRLELKPVDLNGLLKDAAERAQLTSDKHYVVTDLDLALPVITGDSDRLVQVVSNLLSNAVKYSPDGGEVRLTSRFEGDTVHVSVTDQGRGIPKDFLDKVFGRYERFESNHTAKVAGTGLGLAISRQIVELHGGRIWVESEVGRGSVFHFTVPVAQAKPAPTREPAREAAA